MVPSWRAAQSPRGQNARELPAGPWSTEVATKLVAMTGLLRAGQRRRQASAMRSTEAEGRTSVPVVTALVGATVAVIALVATSVFGASLTHLVSTPSLYGQNWQRWTWEISTTPQLNAALATMKLRPRAVTKITWAYSGKVPRHWRASR